MTNSGKLAALALAGLLGSAAPVIMAEQAKDAIPAAVEPVMRQSKRNLLRMGGIIPPWSYPDGPGWTVAQVKRMAKKKRDRARHRAACRGRK